MVGIFYTHPVLNNGKAKGMPQPSRPSDGDDGGHSICSSCPSLTLGHTSAETLHDHKHGCQCIAWFACYFLPAHRCLRSASSADLVVPSTHSSTIGDRASFAVTAPRAWNSPPPALRLPSTSHNISKAHLKSFTFG